MIKDKNGQEIKAGDEITIRAKVSAAASSGTVVMVDIGGQHVSVPSTVVEKVPSSKRETVQEAAQRGFNDQGG